MKRILAVLLAGLLIFCFAACDNNIETEDNSSKQTADKLSSTLNPTTETSSEKVYVDAATNFDGMVTILGRWHCVASVATATGTTTDVSGEGQYYIFQSNGKVEIYYMDELMIEYDSYTFVPEKITGEYKEGTVTLVYGNSSITLGCIVEEKGLTLYTKNAGNQNYRTHYERVDYTETQKETLNSK